MSLVMLIYLCMNLTYRLTLISQRPSASVWSTKKLVSPQTVTFHVTGTLGGVLVRHRYDVHIDGEQAEAVITGASILNGDRQAHHLVRLSHHVGNSGSQQTFTAVADDQARSSFDGLVRVDVGADGTDAEQSNRNMSLSPDARIATRPQLDVFADDVAAGHGATIGAPQEEEIAYLRTRGLTRDQARALLIQGFAREPLNEISDPHLRERPLDSCWHPAPPGCGT